MKAPVTVGRATATDREDGSQVWRLPADASDAAGWLHWMGQRGIGGFVEQGTDAQGIWLVRRFRGIAFNDWLQRLPGPVPWRDAVAWMQQLAERLAECEERSVFPGAINPHNVLVVLEDRAVELVAESWVTATVGGPVGADANWGSKSSRWMAPEHAGGQTPTAASNRYVIGLLTYRMLAAEHPFGGMGLRLALEQAQRGAPPMREAIATTLPPGLQSLCLRMLEAAPSARPASAREIADRLGEFLAERKNDAGLRTIYAAAAAAAATAMPAAEPAVSAAPTPTAQPKPKPKTSRDASAWPRRLATLAVTVVPLVVGTAAGIVALSQAPSSATPAEPARDGDVPKPEQAALTVDTTTADQCAVCHPSQTAQWHRSVMGHSAKSPLFQALEILIQEQVGRSDDCRHGAGVLREADAKTACTNPATGLPITGAGGALWCVNCHVPVENLDRGLPPWDGKAAKSDSRLPLRDLYGEAKMEGIGCAFCHQVQGPSRPGNLKDDKYEGNPYWTSFVTGEKFFMRPEDLQGTPGIANSGYFLDPSELLVGAGERDEPPVPGGAHLRPTRSASDYLKSSEFCGSCHDVRLFGADGFGVEKGEHFKRLRNAYSEWVVCGEAERAAGREPSSCQDCHMSLYPGVCEPGQGDVPAGATALQRACPEGTHFAARQPGDYPNTPMAAGSAGEAPATTHYFTGVDAPLTPEFNDDFIDQDMLDAAGLPLGAHQRRDLLLGRTFRFEIETPGRSGDTLELPVVIENVGGGHRVPAGFSQEREFWVHLLVTDGDGKVVYEVGRVDAGDEDLRDKIFERINVSDERRNEAGQPLGLFGANVVNGPDHPEWDPDPLLGGTEFRGHGLINLQNGFLRCVSCRGRIADDGSCQPGLFQNGHRADRYDDGVFDIDTGECKSNIDDHHRYFEVFFPVGALDAERGTVRGPDAIIDTRSAPHGVPLHYTYELDVKGRPGPFRAQARLMFRAFPPFLVRGFADYEAAQAKAGLRPSGPLVTHDMLERLEAVELHRVEVTVK